ncbi:hypothetical protein LCGC14_2591220 [marine sediment metagenome]|uniref:Uncharacterized protein n=1 Tax=marine sediment metagenome TaxID=412755 RepID=A0A0F9D4B9_9ZZZZ
MTNEIGLWVLVTIGSFSLINLVLLGIVIRLFYHSLDRQKDILNQIRHLGMAASGILELEDDD